MTPLPLHPIPEDKRTALVAAAVREFAAAGYSLASTNRIVEAAHVSKGLLFHYFGDKKGLYLYVAQSSLARLVQRFDDRVGTTSTDLFERLRQYTFTKWSLIAEDPSLFVFLQQAMSDPPEELQEELQAVTADITASTYRRLFEGIDTSKFRPGVPLEHVIRLLSSTFDGLGSQYAALLRQKPLELESVRRVMFEEVETYVGLLRHGVESGTA
jgi:TetR/AcrR family transcriptional regulator